MHYDKGGTMTMEMHGQQFRSVVEHVDYTWNGRVTSREVTRWQRWSPVAMDWRACTDPHTWVTRDCRLCEASYTVEPDMQILVCEDCVAECRVATASYPLDAVTYGVASIDAPTAQIIAPVIAIEVQGHACTMTAENLGGMECVVGVRIHRADGTTIY